MHRISNPNTIDSSISLLCFKTKSVAVYGFMQQCEMAIWGNALYGLHSARTYFLSPVHLYHMNRIFYSSLCGRRLFVPKTDINLPTVTCQAAFPNWMERRSQHRIWFLDLYPYFFCQKYEKKHHQMKEHGEFEIYFVIVCSKSYLP